MIRYRILEGQSDETGEGFKVLSSPIPLKNYFNLQLQLIKYQ